MAVTAPADGVDKISAARGGGVLRDGTRSRTGRDRNPGCIARSPEQRQGVSPTHIRPGHWGKAIKISFEIGEVAVGHPAIIRKRKGADVVRAIRSNAPAHGANEIREIPAAYPGRF